MGACELERLRDGTTGRCPGRFEQAAPRSGSSRLSDVTVARLALLQR